MSLADAFHRDDGSRNEPGVDSPWDAWVAASKTANFCDDDPLLDWLNLYGRSHGFISDDERPGFDPRTDFRPFVFARARAFEQAAVRWFGERHQLETICNESAATRTTAAVEATWDAMRRGVEMVAQGVLWNPETQTYGAPDLLVRSDVLQRIFPTGMSEAAAARSADALSIGPAHYRVVDVKFTTLELLRDGHAGANQLKYMVQVWIYNEALGRMQGLVPTSAYLLGRRWTAAGNARGSSALERLARVDRHWATKNGVGLASHARQACEWVRRVRSEGSTWQVLPVPSVEELWPNLRAGDDQPWHTAKREIGSELEDLTALPRVTPSVRAAGLTAGISRWTDPLCCAARLGVTGAKHAALLDAVIAANQSPDDGPVVFPARVTANKDLWRSPAVPEFCVDFETVSDLDDDFSTFPAVGGQPLIFMIGCGHFDGPPGGERWDFRVFTVASLCAPEERRIIEEWLAHVHAVSAAAGVGIEGARFIHWSPAEQSVLTTAYNAARKRHGDPPWPELPWCDLLNSVIKTQPVTVRGAFGFGLKAIAKAMHAHGLIETVWDDGPTDGLGAMVGAWWCHGEARARGVVMTDLSLMTEITRYNEVDCRVMAEVLAYLRAHR